VLHLTIDPQDDTEFKERDRQQPANFEVDDAFNKQMEKIPASPSPGDSA
jgi:hypothetical protein